MNKGIVIFWIIIITVFMFLNTRSNFVILLSALVITFVTTYTKKQARYYENDQEIEKWINQIERSNNESDIEHSLLQLKDYKHSIDNRYNSKKLNEIIDLYDKKRIQAVNTETFNPHSIAVGFTKNSPDDKLES